MSASDAPQASLFSPLTLRGTRFHNRIVISPMCTYSATDGLASDWHLVHLGQFALGGAATVFTEAAAVEPRGRITHGDLGIWSADHAAALKPVTEFIRRNGALPAIQIAHAGRKASMQRPWHGNGPIDDTDRARGEDIWDIVAASAEPVKDGWLMPAELSVPEIEAIQANFAAAAGHAADAGFEVLEIHSAHGYLAHSFLSPLSNRRDDAWGGGFEGRLRALHDVIAAVREVWPEQLPLWLRISATDWAEGGWDIEQSVALAQGLVARGVDLVDVSSGGLVPHVEIPVGPGYQVPFAARIRREANIATGAVGMITAPDQAQRIIRAGDADVVLLARELLRDPYFPRRAAQALQAGLAAPEQYLRAW